jgi:hypothetical protein
MVGKGGSPGQPGSKRKSAEHAKVMRGRRLVLADRLRGV